MAVRATFKPDQRRTFTSALHQHDKNQRLLFAGVELPNLFMVHFSNDEHNGVGTSHKATPEGVIIPDEYLDTGEYVYAWLNLSDSEGSIALYEVVIPVERKPSAIIVDESEMNGFVLGDNETLIIV